MNRERNRKLVKAYGITIEDYNALLAKQGGQCAICKQFRKLVVDHCHDQQKVRGLLCDACNTGIGLLREDPELFARALEYLADNSNTKEST